MNTHGYRLVANSKTANPDFIPSLIGVEEQQESPNGADTYFERVEIGDIELSSIAISRWVSYDSLPSEQRDPILGVKTLRGLSFYITLSELHDLAVEQNDTDTLALIKAMPRLKALLV